MAKFVEKFFKPVHMGLGKVCYTKKRVQKSRDTVPLTKRVYFTFNDTDWVKSLKIPTQRNYKSFFYQCNVDKGDITCINIEAIF